MSAPKAPWDFDKITPEARQAAEDAAAAAGMPLDSWLSQLIKYVSAMELKDREEDAQQEEEALAARDDEPSAEQAEPHSDPGDETGIDAGAAGDALESDFDADPDAAAEEDEASVPALASVGSVAEQFGWEPGGGEDEPVQAGETPVFEAADEEEAVQAEADARSPDHLDTAQAFTAAVEELSAQEIDDEDSIPAYSGRAEPVFDVAHGVDHHSAPNAIGDEPYSVGGVAAESTHDDDIYEPDSAPTSGWTAADDDAADTPVADTEGAALTNGDYAGASIAARPDDSDEGDDTGADSDTWDDTVAIVELALPTSDAASQPSEPEIAAAADALRSGATVDALVVRPSPVGDGGYEVVCGAERLIAARRLGVDRLPAEVRDIADDEVPIAALTDRLRRRSMSPIAEAKAYRMLLDETGLDATAAGMAVGRSATAIDQAIALLDLPEAVQGQIERNELSAMHARVLAQAEDPAAVAREVVARRLDIYQTEQLVRTGGGAALAADEADGAESVDIDAEADGPSAEFDAEATEPDGAFAEDDPSGPPPPYDPYRIIDDEPAAASETESEATGERTWSMSGSDSAEAEPATETAEVETGAPEAAEEPEPVEMPAAATPQDGGSDDDDVWRGAREDEAVTAAAKPDGPSEVETADTAAVDGDDTFGAIEPQDVGIPEALQAPDVAAAEAGDMTPEDSEDVADDAAPEEAPAEEADVGTSTDEAAAEQRAEKSEMAAFLEQRLSSLLGMPVTIDEHDNAGVLSVRFADRDDLNEIVSRLNSAGAE